MADSAEPNGTDGTIKPTTVARKELAIRVQKATGAKLKDVQLIIRATLQEMSDALKAGEQLRLPPFGAARVLRPADPVSGEGMRVALREVKAKAPKPDASGAAVKEVKAVAAVKADKAAKPKPKPKRAAPVKQGLAAKGKAE